MNTKQQQVQMAFRRTIGFVKDRPALTEGDSSEARAIGNAAVAMGGVVQRMAAHATSQHTLASAATKAARDEDVLQDTLIKRDLRSIAMIARGLRGRVPGIGVLRLPSSNLRKLHLIEAATAFARQAEIYREPLVEHGMPSDGIEQLDAAIEAVRNSYEARSTSRAELQGATRGVEEEIALGRKILATLDGIMLRVLHDQPAEITVWRAAKRLSRASSSGRSTALPVVVAPLAVQPAAAEGQKAA